MRMNEIFKFNSIDIAFLYIIYKHHNIFIILAKLDKWYRICALMIKRPIMNKRFNWIVQDIVIDQSTFSIPRNEKCLIIT